MHQHIHIHKIHILKDELSEVYFNLSIQSFALSLISVFIPIYLLGIGYSFNEMLIFFIIIYATLGLLSPFCAMLANRIGFKHMIILRTPFLITFLFGLNLIEIINIPLYALAFIGGLSSSLYWNSINSIFAEHSNKLHRGSQTGKMISMPNIASLAGPTIGGILAYMFGFKTLFIITTFFILISLIPLFFTKDTKPHVNFSIKKMFRIKSNMRFFIYNALNGTRFIAGMIFWPLFIYWGLDGSTTGTGLSRTITSVGIILLTFYVGHKTDHSDKYKYIKKGALFVGLLWFIRIFSTTQTEFFALSFLAGFFAVLIDLPFTAASFDQANKENPDEFVVFREMSINTGRVIFMFLTLLISDSVLKMYVGFSLAGLASLAFLFF